MMFQGKPCYKGWDAVPDHLKTKTGIKNAGKRRRPRQPIVAYVDTTTGRYGGTYALYDLNDALEKRPVTEAQREAFRQVRASTECRHCYNSPVKTNKNGYCWRCQEYLDEVAERNEQRKQNRRGVIEWAQRITSGPWVTLDTETTNLDPGYIVDIAIIDGPSGQALLNTLVNPGVDIPAKATNVHGITDAMVRDAPFIHELRPEIERHLSNTTCVIYNASFDLRFLECSLIRYEQERIECAMLKYARYAGDWSEYYGDWRYQSLWSACQDLGVDLREAHRAFVDASALRECVIKLAQQEDVS